MGKKLNYIIGAILIAAGILLAATYKFAMVNNLLGPVILISIVLIGRGTLLIYTTRSLHKAVDNLQQIEQSITDKTVDNLQQIEQSITEAEQTPEDVGTITITRTHNGMSIECSNMDFHERISALEVAKSVLINQRIKNGKEKQ